MKISLLLFLTVLSLKVFSQDLKYRSVDYYLDTVAKLEMLEMKKVGLIDDELNVVKKYRGANKKTLNKEGYEKYYDIKVKIMQSVYKDYLFQQHVENNDDVYVLYFSMAGFDDTQWQVLRWKKKDWDRKDKIDLQMVEEAKLDFESEKKSYKYNFEPVMFNYDEGPKNLENVRLFIKNDYLVMERGNLYHSLYDMKLKKIIVNEENPWHASNMKDEEKLNGWIKTNLHDKIAKVIN